jgi:hypothetical protein
MDTVGTSKTGPSVGSILIALVVGLIVGFFIKGAGNSHKPAFLGGDPCGSGGSGGTNSHQVDVNDANQPCIETNLDSTKTETVIWSAPANYHPIVAFRDTRIPTPVVTGDIASWVHPPGPTNQPTAAYIVNILPTQVWPTPKPGQATPTPGPSPTPGMYGRIIIKP